jgi:hypothetical protein
VKLTSLDLQTFLTGTMLLAIFKELVGFESPENRIETNDGEPSTKVAVPIVPLMALAAFVSACYKRFWFPWSEKGEQLCLQMEHALDGEQDAWDIPITPMTDAPYGFEFSEMDVEWLRILLACLKQRCQIPNISDMQSARQELSHPADGMQMNDSHHPGSAARGDTDTLSGASASRRATSAAAASDASSDKHYSRPVLRQPTADDPSAWLSGPLMERDSASFHSLYGKIGAHYNIYQIDGGMTALRKFFSTCDVDPWNLVLFSTSGMHGTYNTIEDIEAGLQRYGDHPQFSTNESEWPEDWRGNELTVLIVHPRLVCMRFGVVTVTLADIEFLKGLRDTSYEANRRIGSPTFRQLVREVKGEIQSLYLPVRPPRPFDN